MLLLKIPLILSTVAASSEKLRCSLGLPHPLLCNRTVSLEQLTDHLMYLFKDCG